MTINSLRTTIPAFLSNQDQVEIVAPAKFVCKNDILYAIETIDSYGFNVKIKENLFLKKDVFAGTVKQRIQNFQTALNNKDTKAIFFARGGYGSIQIIDHIDFTEFLKHPKWLIGFSDITIILMHLYVKHKINSIHGPMPFNFKHTETKSLEMLFQMLRGNKSNIQIVSHDLNQEGKSRGRIVGGNLSILCSLIGSMSFFSSDEEYILLIEDVDEYLYRLERMMYMLDRSGVLKKIKGLIIGSMTKITDNKIPFGKTAYKLICDIVSKYDYPIAFNFPVGHDRQNYPIMIGAKIVLDVNSSGSKIQYQ